MTEWRIPGKEKPEQPEQYKPYEEPEAPSSQYESPKPYVVTKKKKTVAQIERETDGGRNLPRPVCPFDDIVDPQINAMSGRYAPPAQRYISALKRDPRSCMTCTPSKRGTDCADQCSVPGFFEASIMTLKEVREHDAWRAENQRD
jgi:hypothetical protein